MKDDIEELIAERAAEWVHRLEAPGDNDRAGFMHWVRESPLHVREFLVAMAERESLREIRMPPLHGLVWVSRLLGKLPYEVFVQPLLADIYQEYYKAIAEGHEGRAKWIILRGYWDVMGPLRAAVCAALSAWLKLRGS